MAETITVQMDRIFNEYRHRVDSVFEVANDRVARETVRRIRANSPKKTGSYARGWTIKRVRTRAHVTDLIIHNRTDYQLTHLLEYGHMIVNGKGSFGRAPGHPHIKPAEQWANNELPAEIEREL